MRKQDTGYQDGKVNQGRKRTSNAEPSTRSRGPKPGRRTEGCRKSTA
jgi:hypothetical protein